MAMIKKRLNLFSFRELAPLVKGGQKYFSGASFELFVHECKPFTSVNGVKRNRKLFNQSGTAGCLVFEFDGAYIFLEVPMFKHLKSDLHAILDRDPAAHSMLEALLCYPGYRAIRRHRRAHWLYTHNFIILSRLLSERTRKLTGIDIHPGAKLGEGVFIDHGTGVVIGETAEVGNNVTIYQGATLGGTGKETGKRHPTIGNNVMISAGAKVLGPFKVGDNSKIGAGAVVLEEVPPNCTVVGIPGRIVRINNKACDPMENMDQMLPDPVLAELQRLCVRISELERKINKEK